MAADYAGKAGATRAAKAALGPWGDFEVVQSEGGRWYWIDTSAAAAAAAGAENDPDAPVVGADLPPAVEVEVESEGESEDGEALHLAYPVPAATADLILAIGTAIGVASKWSKVPRASVAAMMAQEAAQGVLPGLPTIPESNSSARRHAAALRALAEAGDLGGLMAYPVGAGTNTYAKMIRAYRDALATVLAAALPISADMLQAAAE